MSAVVPTNKTDRIKVTGKAAGYRAKRRFILISLVPILLLFGVFAFLPIAWSLGLSVFKYDPLSSKALFVGADNYIRMARDAVFLKSLWVTFKFVTITVLINIVITLLIASAIQRVSIPWLKSLFRTVFFFRRSPRWRERPSYGARCSITTTACSTSCWPSCIWPRSSGSAIRIMRFIPSL
ncbi:hypothetical protein HMSSN036_31460 [Paenibacillus macerans]|nr:hypothetical protein HMSSN036_31460 [Paenibacillus macerans]